MIILFMCRYLIFICIKKRTKITQYAGIWIIYMYNGKMQTRIYRITRLQDFRMNRIIIREYSITWFG